MTKPALAAFAALIIASPAVAQPAEPPQPDAHASHHPAAPETEPTAEGTGQVKSVDLKAGTITIHHGPIQALGWPAMTMTFKAAPDVLKSAKAGQTIKFTLQGPENEVVAIQPQ